VDLIADSVLVAESPQGREYKLEAYLSLALDPGHTALDVGCGPGTDLPALAEAVTVTGSVIGVDLRPTMVAEARRRMADVPWVQVLEGDAAALPLENNRVDRALADRTPQDVEDPANVFAEIHRVLCPGGIAVVADFDWPRSASTATRRPASPSTSTSSQKRSAMRPSGVNFGG
jgi:ubiquinone/menaquinone biosynthesis C-methylase UbiE